MSEQNLQHLGRHHTGSQMTGEANRWTRAIFDVDVGQIYGAPMRRGWCYSSYNATNLSTVFIASDRSKYRSNVIPLGSKTTQAVLNPSGPAPSA